MIRYTPTTRAALALAIATAVLLATAPARAGLPHMLKDVDPGSGQGLINIPFAIGSTTFFAGADPATGWELWKTDGTTSGTVLVKDIEVGAGSSYPDQYCAVGGVLYFSAYDSSAGTELWKSDGTTAGTMRVMDIRPGPNGSDPTRLTCATGGVFFVADDGLKGTELWYSDGTAAGTALVQDITVGPDGTPLVAFASLGGRVVFVAYTTGGFELWASDGTSAATTLLRGFSSMSGTPFVVGGTAYFAADGGSNGTELWKTDATIVGTVMVRDINNPGPASSNPSDFASAAGVLYFTASDGTNGQELWKSDGTTAGTVMVKNIALGSESAYPEPLAAVGDTLFFMADDQVHGNELWKSDGSAAGTVLVHEIAPGPAPSEASDAVVAGGLLYVSISDYTDTYLWRSDGTDAGTFPVAGPPDLSDPQWVAADGNGVVYFNAYTDTAGFELWALNGCSSPLGYDPDECADTDFCTHSFCNAESTCVTMHAPLPAGNCEVPIVPGKASFQVKDSATNAADQFAWKWLPGNFLTFEDPVDLPVRVNLCAYDANGIVLRANIPGGPLCAGVSCWTSSPDSDHFKFKDATGAFDGLQSLVLKFKTAKSKIIAKGKGTNLRFTPPPWSGPITVELSGEAGCMQATYSTPTKNEAGQYKAKGD